MSYAIGVLLAVVTIVLAAYARFERRTFFATVACVNGTYYVLFAVIGGGSRVLLIESAVSLAFMIAALAGFRRNLVLVAAVIGAHGAFDLLHPHVVTNSGLPLWWPPFCLTYDVTAALLLLLLARRTRTSDVRVRHQSGLMLQEHLQ